MLLMKIPQPAEELTQPSNRRAIKEAGHMILVKYHSHTISQHLETALTTGRVQKVLPGCPAHGKHSMYITYTLILLMYEYVERVCTQGFKKKAFHNSYFHGCSVLLSNKFWWPPSSLYLYNSLLKSDSAFKLRTVIRFFLPLYSVQPLFLKMRNFEELKRKARNVQEFLLWQVHQGALWPVPTRHPPPGARSS